MEREMTMSHLTSFCPVSELEALEEGAQKRNSEIWKCGVGCIVREKDDGEKHLAGEQHPGPVLAPFSLSSTGTAYRGGRERLDLLDNRTMSNQATKVGAGDLVPDFER